MLLKVIVDNNTYIDQYYCGEPAVSFYIEDDGRRVLFDAGYSDLFLKNMNKFGIEIDELDSVVISHGHDDHTRGLKFLFDKYKGNRLEVIGHPLAFEPKYFDDEMIGSPISKEVIMKICELRLSKSPIIISNNLTFLGEIPQKMLHENRKSIGRTVEEGQAVDDYIFDDSALVYRGKEGIYIITGCSHSGICNIIEYAKQVTECENVIGIIGGFHLFELNESTCSTIDYLAKSNVDELYPCHCTSFKVKAEINKVIEVKEVGVGLTLNWT